MKTKNTLRFGLAAAVISTSSLSAQDATSSDEDLFELSPFVVQTESDGYRAKEASTGTLIAMDISEVPMDVTVIEEGLFEDLGLYNTDDLGLLVASVSSDESPNTNGGGGNTRYNLRGFRSVPRRNGFAPGGRLYDLTGVSRVEIIKGPNSVLYGQTDPGGIINYVPKRPLFDQRITGSVVVGTDQHFRIKGDITGPIGDSKRFAYRLPFSYREFQREMNFFEWDRTVFAPSFLMRFGRSTEIMIEGEYLNQNTNLADMSPYQEVVDGTRVWDVTRRGLGREFNRLGPNTYSENTQRNITAELTTNLTDFITLRAMYTFNVRETEIYNLLVDNVNPRFLRPTPLANRIFVSRPENQIEGYKIDLLWEKTIFGIESQTVFGYEQNRNWFKVINYRSLGFPVGPVPNPLNGDVVDPAAWDLQIPWVWDLDEEARLEYYRLFRDRGNQSFWQNWRVTETLHLMDDNLIVLGGIARGAVDRVTLYDENVRVPGIVETSDDVVYTFGATYRLSPKVGFFANTSTSFIPVYRTGLDGSPLDPQSGVGYEFGVKLNLLDDSFFATITYFDLTNDGREQQRPADPDNGIDEAYWVNAGEQQAKGIEIELNWNITSQLEVYASFVHFDGEITNDVNTDLIGRPLQKSPETAAQMTVNYKFAQDGPLKGLRIGGFVSYKSKAYQNPTNQIGLVSDDYVVVNCFGRYRLPFGKEFDVFFNAKNILDEDYISEGGGYGRPFTIDFGLSRRW
jgi:iron complex outermembrane receptor protein